jgi:hypothetical protein
MATATAAAYSPEFDNMKAPQVSTTARALLCAALIASTCTTHARTPQARTERGPAPSVERNATPAGEPSVGTVGRVNQRARVLRFQRYGAMLPMNLTWNSHTVFLAGGQSVTAARLSPGDIVTVWYHTPIFGKPIASQIVIRRAPAPASQPGGRRR